MKGRTFTRLMITYASCFVILIAIALSSYVVAYDIYEDMCLDGNAEAMANGLDVMADEMERFSLLVSQQRTLSDFTRVSTLAHPFEPRQLLWLEFARSRLALSVESMALNDSVIDCALIYQNGACITLKRTFEQLSDYYGTYFFIKDMSLPEWRTMLIGSADSGRVALPSQVAYAYDYGQLNALIVVQSAKYHYGSDITNVAYMIIDADAALSDLVTPDVAKDCFVALYKGDNVLATLGQQPTGDYRALEVDSTRLTGVRVYVEIPMAFISRQLRPLVAIFAVSVGAYLVLGVVLTIWFSYRNSAPMRTLSQMICQMRGGMPQANEYAYVAGEIGRMDGDLRRTHLQLAEREREMRAAMLERLLCGAPYGAQYSERDMFEVLFHNFPDMYCLCMMRVAVVEGAAPPSHEAISQQLRREFGERIEPHASGDTLLFILPLDPNGPGAEQYRKQLDTLRERLYSELGLRAHIALSDGFTGAESLITACNQARQLIRIMPGGASYTVLRSDIAGARAYVPVEYTDSQRFYESLMACDGQSALAMVSNALDGVRGTVDGYAQIEQVFYAFQRVLDRIEFELNGCGIAVDMKYECKPTDTVDELANVLRTNVGKALDGIAASRELRTRKFNEAVMAYIDAHICDVELSARTVAERFSLPERELQALTRAAEGVSFFDYVENRRMARAREQILTTDLPVHQIATNRGFALTNSFYKAFKRRFGTSPSALRASANAELDCESDTDTVIEQ